MERIWDPSFENGNQFANSTSLKIGGRHGQETFAIFMPFEDDSKSLSAASKAETDLLRSGPVSKDWWSQSPTRLAEDDGTQQMILIDTD